MTVRVFRIALVACLVCGCIHLKPKVPEISQLEAPFETFFEKNFDWTSVRRIVVMPFGNASLYNPTANQEIQTNLALEIQRVGRFEVAVASYEDPAARSSDIFATGQFDEMQVLRIAREYRADAVLFGNLTQYHPYSPPRVGLSLLLVHPAEGIPIASVSGVWDAREASTATQAQAYLRRTQSFPRSLMGADRITDSPIVFQRFVCQQIAVALCPTANGGACPPGAVMPPERPQGTEAVPPFDAGLAPDAMVPLPSGRQAPSMSPPPIPPASSNSF